MLKEFTVDWDDLKSLKKHMSILQKRRKYLLRQKCSFTQINFGASVANYNDIAPIFDFLYSLSLPLTEEVLTGEYYVYVHCDPTKPLNIRRDVREILLATKYGLTHMPFYVGKGIGDRCNDLSRNEGHRKIRTKLLQQGKDIQVKQVKVNLTERTALFEEQKLISFLGLSSLDSKGFLVNLQTDTNIINYFETQLAENFYFPLKQTEAKIKPMISLMKKWI